MHRRNGGGRWFLPGPRLWILGAAALSAFAPASSGCVERIYSRRVYLWLQGALTAFSNRTDLALFDVLVAFLAVSLIGWWVIRMRRAPRGRRARATIGMTVNTAVTCAAVYLLFLACWGLNYRREPLSQKLDFDEARVTQDALVSLTRESVSRLNQLHAPAHAASWPGLSDIRSVLAVPFARAQQRLPSTPAAVPGRPKTSLLGVYFRRAAIDGMTDPFFLEVLINEEVLPFEQPYVVAHEWAHLAGYADEAEASFVGWLTCQAGEAPVQYSGWLFLFARLLQQVPRAQRASLTEPLMAGPRGDLDAIAERLRGSTPFVRRQAERVYDRFLKANRVAEGIASYDGVVRLVLGARLTN